MPLMTLVNAYWQNGVNVDVRVGPYMDPNQNPALPSFKLAMGQQWSNDTGTNDLCFRRDLDPDHPNGAMTDWTVLSSANGDQTCDV
jgi:hypothetical protein